MSQSHASPTASRRADAAGPEPVSQTGIAGRSARSTLARIARLSIGTLLVLVALVLLGAGGTGVWADRGQRDAGYVTTSAHNFTTTVRHWRPARPISGRRASTGLTPRACSGSCESAS